MTLKKLKVKHNAEVRQTFIRYALGLGAVAAIILAKEYDSLVQAGASKACINGVVLFCVVMAYLAMPLRKGANND